MKIYPGNWLINSAILGFLRLQNLNGKKYNLSQNYIEIEPNDFDGFEQVYFNYALIKGFPYYLKFNFIKKLKKYLSDERYYELQSSINELLENFINRIKPVWNNYEETIHSITTNVQDLEINIEKLITELNINNANKNIIEEFKNETQKLYEDLKSKEHKNIYIILQKFFFNKAIIGNSGFKGKNRMLAFEEYYVKPAKNALVNPTSGNFFCKFCGENKVDISDFHDVNKFFGEGMFSPIGVSLSFQNFFYNLQPDFIMCDFCELILLCSWIGFTKIPWKFRDDVNDTEYIFVNVPDLELLVEENEKLQSLYATSELDLKGTIYDEILYDLFVKEKEKKSKWALQNILFVEIKTVPRKDQNKPKFKYFHIGKDIAQLFIDETAIKSMREIKGKIFIRKDENNPNKNVFVYARRDTIRRILSRDSLYHLCYLAVKDQIEKPSQINTKNAFNISLLSAIRKNIWDNYKKGELAMESKQIFGILKSFYVVGEELAKGLDYDKRKRLSYRLLSLIRAGKITDFYEALMKLFISQNKTINQIMIGILNTSDEVQPESKAYAFMSGFLSEQQENDISEKNKNVE